MTTPTSKELQVPPEPTSVPTSKHRISPTSILLDIKNVKKSFSSGQHTISILEKINLTIHSQESVALSGRSGSGKSTLIHLIAGIEKADQGLFLWKNKDLTQFTDSQRSAWRLKEIGFLFQDFRLFPHLTALENVALPLELLGKTAQEGEAEAEHRLNEVGLKDRLHHKPSQLSGGEQQRVALARALIHKPALILADEPTGNLDWRSAQDITNLLLALPQNNHCAVLIVTHDLKLAHQTNTHFQIQNGTLTQIPTSSTPT